MGKTISIIIPTYNSESYITRCLDSLKNQTIKPYEIIIVNDGSTDNTLSILQSYEGLDLNIISIENHGQGYARNLALTKAQGDYIWYIDSDDTITNNSIEVLTNRINNEDVDVINFDYAVVYLDGRKKSYSKFKDFTSVINGDECSVLLSNTPYFTVNNIYNREFLINNDIKYGEGYIYEDIEFWVKVSLNAKKVIFLKQELYQVIKEETSTTNAGKLTDKHYKNFLIATRKTLEYTKNIDDKNLKYLNRYLISRFFLYYSRRTPKGKSRKEFLHSFVDLMNECNVKEAANRVYNLLIKLKVFEKKKYFILACFVKLYCIRKYIRR